ncbi:hypothetical protein D7X55_27295 [Corallococcus sp. AB049A]|uniref:Uncharacterized protein n=1 Tax=Corallococcus interemptor TaxID=2316720 RepID=A0A3A8Q0N4_9BACT|nr:MULTISPECIES: hypothetical protein [Corallococcus]RKH41446.1 hypothetical protein D7Y23_32990 [Corallococcus sp. AB050B]RKH62319.1 hypothetical protein D7X96_29980 [Corallococcus interemptor]RKI57949.1 hypothetical protein D7X55_27295 [Corallococcus sp. AB049A]
MASPHLVHAEDVPWTELAHGSRVALKRKQLGVFAGAAPGGDKASRTLHAYLPLDAQVDYWEGEEP